jgi:hypothetical protein
MIWLKRQMKPAHGIKNALFKNASFSPSSTLERAQSWNPDAAEGVKTICFTHIRSEAAAPLK